MVKVSNKDQIFVRLYLTPDDEIYNLFKEYKEYLGLSHNSEVLRNCIKTAYYAKIEEIKNAKKHKESKSES